jgi:hypothetical protein
VRIDLISIRFRPEGHDKGGGVFSRSLGFIWLTAFGLHSSAAVAQAASPNEVRQPCDKACQQRKLDTLFKAIDDAEISQHPKPSNAAGCAAYDGHDLPDVFLDVCAKLKYVRSLPSGKTSRFSCPNNDAPLVGTSMQRIVTAWGEPDFVEGTSPPDRAKSDGQWTYFLGRTKPGWVGGGFAELTLYFVDGVVRKVDCGLAR